MRKLMIIFMALLLPFTALEMRADEENAAEMKIPIYKTTGKLLGRTLMEVEAYYFNDFSCIYTLVPIDLGEIQVMVVNCLTGESWYDTFDSGLEAQNILQISGESGIYKVTYLTISGDMYIGSFIID